MNEKDLTTDVAVIGMAGRFPGADSITAFWDNLCSKKDVRQEFSDEELLALNLVAEKTSSHEYIKKGYCLNDIDRFAASFFDVTPRQARMLDPQQRLFLETAWQALEHAGYIPDQCPGHVGVYAGANFNNYIFNVAEHFDMRDADIYLEALIANDKDYLTSRVSHKFNFTGPAVSVQTSCSTSLTAIAIAYQALLDYQCDMAVAGGAGLNIPQERGYRYFKEGGLSKDAACHAFDIDSTGVVHGNGVGAVILKRLEDALADSDNIIAIIKAAAINNDGAKKVAYVAPSVEGQVDVIREALTLADVAPEQVRYIEAHGTGTPVGDPIEFTALRRAYALADLEGVQQKRCALGSAKTNIGHLGAAAGVAGLIKTALTLKHKKLPPSMHFTAPNPELDLDNGPYYVNTELEDWSDEQHDGSLTAAVSSFGIGGTNVHLIMQEAPPLPAKHWQTSHYLLPLSAQTDTALQSQAQQLNDYLTSEQTWPKLADIAYTLQQGRKHFAHRRFIVCDAPDDLQQQLSLSRVPKNQMVVADDQQVVNELAFMFPGVGDQYVGMGADLYSEQTEFKQTIDQCADILQPILKLDIRKLLYPNKAQREQAEAQLFQVEAGLVCLLVLEYALAKQWQAWGIKPTKMIGHSLGEYTAALLAGVFTLEQTLSLVVFRGQLIQRCEPGGMLVVYQDAGALQAQLPGALSLAVINSQRLCMVSGPLKAIDNFEQQLRKNNISFHRLPGDRAGHSSTLDPVLDEFQQFIRAMDLQVPQIPFVSNVTGTWITEEQAVSDEYWTQHLRQTVRFHEGLSVLLKEPKTALLEVGPGRGLTTLAKRHPDASRQQPLFACMRSADKDLNDSRVLYETLGSLWLHQYPIDWAKLSPPEHCRRIALPTYPFERQSYWLERRFEGVDFQDSHKLLQKRDDIQSWFYTAGWVQSPISGTTVRDKSKSACYLLFNHNEALLNSLKQRLQAEGHTVISVDWGTQYQQCDAQHYVVRAKHASDYSRLLIELAKQQLRPQKIIHGWNLTAVNNKTLDSIQGFSRSAIQSRGYYSLLYLLRAMVEQRLTLEDTTLAVLSSQLFNVIGNEVLVASKATLLGPCKVIPYEFPKLGFIHIDLDAKSQVGSWLNKLLADIDNADQRQDKFLSLAYRNGLRWQSNYQTFAPDAATIQSDSNAGKNASLKLRDQGVYLITGAFGGIGYTAAHWLTQRVKQVRLIMLSRSKLPPRKDWSKYLECNADNDQICQRIEHVKALEAMGAEVIVYAVNVAQQAKMRELQKTLHNKFGCINGIIHAAGVVGGGLIQLEDTAKSIPNIQSKVIGTQLLYRLFANDDLDFMLLCSSLGAIAGSLGQVENTAANSFLNAFAEQQSTAQSTTNIISVNWDYWLEVGMILELVERHEKITGAEMQTGILPEEGKQCLSTILQLDFPQILVSTADFHRLIQQRAVATTQALTMFEKADLKQDKHNSDRPDLVTKYLAPRNAVEQVLVVLWQHRLGIESIGVNDNFLELGGDSMLALPLMADMRDALQFDLPIRTLFSEQTVAAIAAFIIDNESAPGTTEEIAQVYLQVQGLSADEVQQALQNNAANTAQLITEDTI